MDLHLEILDWNVRGLNDPAKRNAVREFVATLRVSMVCFQETKVEAIDSFFISQCLGPNFDRFAYLPAEETRGGILMAWDTSVLDVINVTFDTYVCYHRRGDNS
jgi:exonuclease III